MPAASARCRWRRYAIWMITGGDDAPSLEDMARPTLLQEETMSFRAAVVVVAAVMFVLAGASAALHEWLAQSEAPGDGQATLEDVPASGHGWFTPADEADTVNGTLHVKDAARVSDDGWTVTWDALVTCPRGMAITGRVLVAERDPSAIPELEGEDQGITAVSDVAGDRCTGHKQRLRFVLPVIDTVVTDPVTGLTRTYREPISPTPSDRTSAAVLLRSTKSTADGGFFLQYCAAPNCASESGPRISIVEEESSDGP